MRKPAGALVALTLFAALLAPGSAWAKKKSQKEAAWNASGLTKTDAGRQALANCQGADNQVSGGHCKVALDVCNE